MVSIVYPDYKKLEEHYKSLLPTYSAILETFHRDLRDLIEDCIETRIAVKSRIKSFSSYYEKLLKRLSEEKRTGEKVPIHDVLAVRIVCPFLEDLVNVEGLLRSHFRTFEIDHKGAKHSFREFGYDATHVIVEIPKAIIDHYPMVELTTMEIQICTILQDAWAEVEHELIYKKKISPLDEPFRRKLAALNANLSLSDIIFQEIRDYQQQLHHELEKRRESFKSQLDQQKDELKYLSSGNEGTATGEKSTPLAANASMDELLLEALHSHNRKDFTSAIEIYSLLLGKNLESQIRGMLLIHRGMAYFAKTEYNLAVNDFKEATFCQPLSCRSFFHLGTAHRVLDNNAEALKAFQRCIEINPYYFEGLLGLAKTYCEINDFEASLEHLEKALRIKPQSSEALKFRELVLSRMKL